MKKIIIASLIGFTLLAHAASTSTKVAYQCNTNALNMLVAAYDNTQNTPKVTLNFKFKQKHMNETLALIPAGSGAKYEGEGISFWEHHGEATLMFKGNKFICHEVREEK